jgi:hypothetical protein
MIVQKITPKWYGGDLMLRVVLLKNSIYEKTNLPCTVTISRSMQQKQ